MAKKLSFLGRVCRHHFERNRAQYSGIEHIQFDELQTIEHTKCSTDHVAVVTAFRSAFEVTDCSAISGSIRLSNCETNKCTFTQTICPPNTIAVIKTNTYANY